ncbi:MAG: hypothetical protein ACKOU7_04490 [Ferruginibacter sp.]
MLFIFVPAILFGQREPASEKEVKEHHVFEHEHNKEFEELPGKVKKAQGTIIISNTTGTDLSFLYQTDNSAWAQKTIATGYQSTWENISSMSVKMSTENSQTVEYYLTPGLSYSLAWNNAKSCWDFFKNP